MGIRLIRLFLHCMMASFLALPAFWGAGFVLSRTTLWPWIEDHAPIVLPLLLAVFYAFALRLTMERATGRGKSLGRQTGRSLRRLQEWDASSSAVSSHPRF